MVEKPLLKAKDNPFFNSFFGWVSFARMDGSIWREWVGQFKREWVGQFGENLQLMPLQHQLYLVLLIGTYYLHNLKPFLFYQKVLRIF